MPLAAVIAKVDAIVCAAAATLIPRVPTAGAPGHGVCRFRAARRISRRAGLFNAAFRPPGLCRTTEEVMASQHPQASPPPGTHIRRLWPTLGGPSSR